MVIVKKANAEYRVDDTKLSEYLKMGYNQINEKGEVIQFGTAQGIKGLKEQVEKLKSENEQLRGKITELETALKNPGKKDPK